MSSFAADPAHANMPPMDLIADIGNTRTHLGLFDGDRLVTRVDVAHDCSFAERHHTFEALLAAGDAPKRFALCTVNGPAKQTLEAWVRTRLGLESWVLRRSSPDPLPIQVEAPGSVGADRVANAFWAVKTCPGEPVIVVDLGTAITFDVVSAEGAFVGGAIAAGITTCARALNDLTDELPRIDVPRQVEVPPSVIAKTTPECLQGGLFWAAVGLIESGCAHAAKELGGKPRVFATGGDAPLIAPHCPSVEAVLEDLTLLGVRLALIEAQGE